LDGHGSVVADPQTRAGRRGATATSFLAIEDLSVAYGSTRVLQGISLDVARGELVALLGSSGCGKTTLLRAICGFVPAQRGRILVDGRDIAPLPPERRDAALVFQSYALWPHMTAAQNISYGLKVRRWRPERIAERVQAMLRLLELEDLGERRVTDLSGGQRQRVALGRALAVEPKLLLLDEPLSNLDARIRGELRHEIRALQQRLRITALHVTHDREEAMVMADRIVVLDRGRVSQMGTPEELWHRPATPFVASFMGADNVVEIDAEADDGVVAVRQPSGIVRLPAGRDGAHVAARGRGRFRAHFRSHMARLAPADAPAGPALRLDGRVTQQAYLGDGWRYGVTVGDRRYLVDDAARFAPGEAVAVVIPAPALHLFPATNGENAILPEYQEVLS
jgi:putative spermidine/putrescine transport system ATP-binding protein